MAIASAEIEGEVLPTLVVFAGEGSQPLLGMYTLEGFGLGVDGVNERLIRTPGLAMTSFYGAARVNEATLEVRALLDGLAPGEGDLLEGLHRVQHRYGYVPPDAIPALARHFRLPEARVYGSITFYSEFRLTPPPETSISWCSGVACFLKNSTGIRLVLEHLLGIGLGENTPDNRLGLLLGQCNGTCDHAPQVWVDGKVVGPLTASATVELVRDLQRQKGISA
jgi:NADH-quinone oxidoreductase subunit E